MEQEERQPGEPLRPESEETQVAPPPAPAVEPAPEAEPLLNASGSQPWHTPAPTPLTESLVSPVTEAPPVETPAAESAFQPLETAAPEFYRTVEAQPGIPPAAPSVAPLHPPVDSAPLPEVTSVPPVQPEPEAHPAGPNWMLAFVCAWAGATALNEAWVVLVPIGIKAQLLRNTAFLGYALLGFGLVLFAVEALRWGRRREGSGVASVVIPALMTLAGVVALVMSHDPGRRI